MKVLDPILWSNNNYSTPLQPNHRRHTFTTAAAVCLGCGLSLNITCETYNLHWALRVTCTIEMFVILGCEDFQDLSHHLWSLFSFIFSVFSSSGPWKSKATAWVASLFVSCLLMRGQGNAPFLPLLIGLGTALFLTKFAEWDMWITGLPDHFPVNSKSWTQLPSMTQSQSSMVKPTLTESPSCFARRCLRLFGNN